MTMTSKFYDVLIAGSGPAGLSIALGLSRVHRKVAIFTLPDKAGYRNQGASEVHNVLTRDGTPPEEFRAIGISQIKRYGTTDFFEAKIVRMSKLSEKEQLRDGFEVEDSNGMIWRGRKLALAMGSVEVFPDIEGYRENWPQSIYQCMFCDGHERSHLPGGVLTFPDPMSAHVAQMVNLHRTPTSGPVTVFTDGASAETPEMAKAFEIIKALECKIESGKIVRLVPATAPDEGVTVVLEDKQVTVGYLGHKPTTILAGKEMILELGVEVQEHPIFGDNIKTIDMVGSTAVKGVYSAGDAASPLKAATNALSTGATVAAGIVQHLVAEDLAVAMAELQKSQNQIAEIKEIQSKVPEVKKLEAQASEMIRTQTTVSVR